MSVARSPLAGAGLPSADEARRQYLKNLEALYGVDAELAARLDGRPFAATPPLEATSDGAATTRIESDDGCSVYAHSRRRPLDEAARLLDQDASENATTYVFFGLGLGYVAAEAWRRHAAATVFAVEPELGLVKAALALHDWSDAIRAQRLVLLWSEDKRRLHDSVARHNADLMLGAHFLAIPHTRRCGAAFHARMRTLFSDAIANLRTQMVTLLQTSRTTTRNLIRNLPSYVRSAGIDALDGAARGYPAVIVAAGPSLARNARQLAALRERAVLIGVQTTFKLLCALGARPHFVTSLDYHEVSEEFFHGVSDVGDCALVAEPKATWRVVENYPGARRLLAHRAYDALLGAAAPQRMALRPGSTVAHLAFYLAQHLGCDPILFVGQDLAFSDGLFYLPGSPIEQTWGPELGRFQTLEMKQWERIARNRPILRRTRDARGAAIYTDELLFTYGEQFERDFAAAPQRVIQASEGGLPIAGAETLSLSAAAKRYCGRRLPDGLFRAPPEAASSDGPPREALQARERELREMRDIAEKVIRLLHKLAAAVERPSEFNRLVAGVDDLRVKMSRHDALYRLVVDVSAVAELRRYSADRRIGAPEQETPDTARRRLRRDHEFVAAFREGCDFLLDLLPQAIERLGKGHR